MRPTLCAAASLVGSTRIGQYALVQRRQLLVVVAGGLACAGIAVMASRGETWGRVGSGLVVGLFGLLTTLKLTTKEDVVDDTGAQHLVSFMIAAVATFDGVGAFVSGSAFADWTPGRWSLPLGLFFAAGELRDFRRWRTKRRGGVVKVTSS